MLREYFSKGSDFNLLSDVVDQLNQRPRKCLVIEHRRKYIFHYVARGWTIRVNRDRRLNSEGVKTVEKIFRETFDARKERSHHIINKRVQLGVGQQIF